MESKYRFYDFLKNIRSLRRAPPTVKAPFPEPGSPYKPILLLTVLRRIQKRDPAYIKNGFTCNDCKKDFLKVYQGLYGTPEKGIEFRIVQAFWYLGTGKPKIWELSPKNGFAEKLEQKTGKQLRSVNELNKLVKNAHFRTEDWEFLKDPIILEIVIPFIIKTHFPDLGRLLEDL